MPRATPRPIQTRSIIDGAFDAVIVMDAEGVITVWNPRAAAMFGWSAEEAIGRRVSELIIPPGLREQHEAGLRRFLATGEALVLNRVLELPAMHRSGNTFPVELSVSIIRTGKKNSFSGFIRDISERKRADQERALLASIVDSSEDAIFTAGSDG